MSEKFSSGTNEQTNKHHTGLKLTRTRTFTPKANPLFILGLP